MTFRKGYKHTDAFKERRRLSLIGNKYRLGMHITDEAKKAMSLKLKQYSGWSKGRKLIGHQLKGKFKKGIIPWNKGLKGYQSGSKNGNWKGGVVDYRIKIRALLEYKQWRQAVYLRDNFTCQDCGEIGGELHAHHIKKFSDLIQEAIKYLPLLSILEACRLYLPLWNVANGKTVCEKCHKKYHVKKENPICISPRV